MKALLTATIGVASFCWGIWYGQVMLPGRSWWYVPEMQRLCAYETRKDVHCTSSIRVARDSAGSFVLQYMNRPGDAASSSAWIVITREVSLVELESWYAADAVHSSPLEGPLYGQSDWITVTFPNKVIAYTRAPVVPWH